LWQAIAVRRLILSVVLATIAAAAAIFFADRVVRKMPDFEVYWTAASRASRAEPLYRIEDGHYTFKYLPAFAVMARPIAWIPMMRAKPLWFGASILLAGALLWLSVLILPERRLPAEALVGVTLVAMAKFYAHELVLGQVNLLFAAIVACAVLLRERGREAAAGVLFALAVVVKPYAVIFAPWLAVERRRVAFAAMLGALAFFLLLPVLVYGWSGNLALMSGWWGMVASTTQPNLGNQDNVSIAAMTARWLGPGVAAQAAFVVIAAAIGFALAEALLRRNAVRSPYALEASVLLLVIPLLTPQGWDYVLLIATPAIVLLVNCFGELPGVLRVTTAVAMSVTAFSLYDLLGRAGYARFMSWSAITLCALLEVAALIALRAKRIA
jgi:glycosyl transferase family 87